MRADRAVLLCALAALTLSGCMQRRGPVAYAPWYAPAVAQPANAMAYGNGPVYAQQAVAVASITPRAKRNIVTITRINQMAPTRIVASPNAPLSPGDTVTIVERSV